MKTNAMRLMVSTIGSLCGAAGLEHGFFEILQGNAVPIGNDINALGEATRFWRFSFEYAYTIIPNFLITGVVAMILSTAVVVCSLFFIQKKLGWLAFLLFSVLQYLTGGGKAFFGLMIVAGLLASRIDKPQKVWRAVLPQKVRELMGKPWSILLILFSLTFIQSTITAIFGFLYWVTDQEAVFRAQWNMLIPLIGLFLLCTISVVSRESLEPSN
jgi:hypothetical protein